MLRKAITDGKSMPGCLKFYRLRIIQSGHFAPGGDKGIVRMLCFGLLLPIIAQRDRTDWLGRH